MSLSFKNKRIILIEKEKILGSHASTRNSGVIHSAFHLKPGSLKAKFCKLGSRRLINYCQENNIPCKKVGKLVVALNEEEVKRLRIYEKWGKENGEETRILSREEFKRFEPYAECIETIYSLNAAVVDQRKLINNIGIELRKLGVKILTDCKFIKAYGRNKINIETTKGLIETNYLINSAGLYADKIAHSLGFGQEYFIIPIRGDYLEIKEEYSYLVNGMVYPIPDFKIPFLGIHFTKRVDGKVILGPNASLSFGRENYYIYDVNLLEFFETVFNIRFLKLIKNYEFIKLAIKELRKSISVKEFIKEAKRIIPLIDKNMLKRSFSGIRAQLINKDGKLIEDFVIEYDDRSMHILNAVSPGFTSSFAFADYVKNILLNKI